MFADLEEKLESEIVQKSAQLVGAKGIRIVGCTCVGQDYQARSGCYKMYTADMQVITIQVKQY